MELTTSGLETMLDAVRSAESISKAIALVRQIDALKTALESVDRFHEESIKYAMLEAEALVRVVELGGLAKLRSPHKATAEWLYALSADDRGKYIAMCGDGLTIDQVYKREVGSEIKLRAVMAELDEHRALVLNEVKESGIVDTSAYCQMVNKYVQPDLAHDIIDGTRKRLRDAGAIGVGNGSNIYVMPNSGNSEEIKKAIMLRFESISRDFDSIREIVRASGVKMSYAEIDNGSNWSYRDDPYIVHLLIALARIGLISDVDATYLAITKNDWRIELDTVERDLGVSRDKYIRAQYKRTEARA